MAIQGLIFYDEVVLIILCDFIAFTADFPIIFWFLAQVSNAHARKQIFSRGLVFHAKGSLKNIKSYEIFFSHV